MDENKLETYIDWLIYLIAIISLLMTCFNIIQKDYPSAFFFAITLISSVPLMVIRKNMRDRNK